MLPRGKDAILEVHVIRQVMKDWIK